jgi:hypothetical protein
MKEVCLPLEKRRLPLLTMGFDLPLEGKRVGS